MNQTEFAKMTANLVSRGEPFAVATVVRVEGSTVGKPGFKVVISKDGEVLFGSLGGVCPDSAMADAAKKAMSTRSPRTVKVYLESVEKSVEAVVKSKTDDEVHVETNCGGTMEVYVEPYLPQQRLVLVGQGGKDDVEDALVALGKMMDYEVVVIDHAPVLSLEPDQLIKDVDYDLARFKFLESDSVIVLTKGARDVETLAAISKVKLRYVGMMASRQRTMEDLAALRSAGVGEEFVGSLHSPVGLDMGAVTPAEIALSIMSEVVAVKYGRALPSKKLAAERAVQPGGKAP